MYAAKLCRVAGCGRAKGKAKPKAKEEPAAKRRKLKGGEPEEMLAELSPLILKMERITTTTDPELPADSVGKIHWAAVGEVFVVNRELQLHTAKAESLEGDVRGAQ